MEAKGGGGGGSPNSNANSRATNKSNNGKGNSASKSKEDKLQDRCAWKIQTNVGGGQGYLNNRCGGASSMSDDGKGMMAVDKTNNNTKNNVRQGEGSSTGGRSVDDEMFFYTANGLNQYTSIEDMSGNKVLMGYDKNGNLIENDEFLVTNQISPKGIMRNYCVGNYTFFNQKYKKIFLKENVISNTIIKIDW